MKLRILPVLGMLVFIAALALHLSCSITQYITQYTTQYTLTTSVSPTGGGTVTPVGGTYDDGTYLTLRAEPAPGYVFDEWSGDINSENQTSPRTHDKLIGVTMDGNRNINARFKRQYSFNTSVNPAGSGIVKHAAGSFDEGSNVTITAEPLPGYVFDYWSGDISGDMNPTSIVAKDNVDVVANFRPVFAITTVELPTAHVGIPYSFELKAINGSPAYYWSWNLPSIIQGKDEPLGIFYDYQGKLYGIVGGVDYRWTGLSLQTNGVIHGTLAVTFLPIIPKDYSLTQNVDIKVRDSKNNKASKTLQMTLSFER